MAYCVKADIEAVYGATNVAKWADLDNDADAVKIAARIAAAITYAEAYLNSALYGSRYQVPFTTAPTIIVDMCAKSAGLWLYESRGAQDVSPDTGQPVHRLAFLKSEIHHKLRAIKSGGLPLYNVGPVATNVPFVAPVEDASPPSGVDEVVVV